MTDPRATLTALLDSPEMARAYAWTAFAAAFGSVAIQRMTGTYTLVAVIAGLCVVGVAILVVRRRELSLLRIVPTSVLLFAGWALASMIWASEPGYTLRGFLELLGFGTIAVVIAHTRDTLQIVRALGDVLRVLLLASLAVEILSGVLLDMPFPFLGVQGNLALGGPVQGIFGTRNLLGLVTVIALVTFVLELRTFSVPRGLGLAGIALAGGLAVLSASPTVVVLALAVAVTTTALAWVRHTPAARRRGVQWTLGITLVVGLAVAYVARKPIIRLLDAGGDFATRADLWNTLLDFTRFHPVEGWGWFGRWVTSELPFNWVNIATRDRHGSALSSYFDVFLQLGAVGLVLFFLLCGVALVRGWLVASDRRSVLYAWTPLVLVTLLVDGVFESYLLFGVGWMMLVLTAVKAGQSRSWRERMDTDRAQEPPPAL